MHPILLEPAQQFQDDAWESFVIRTIPWSETSKRLFEAMLEPVATSTLAGPGVSSSGRMSPRIVEFLEVAGGRRPELRDALGDLDEVVAEAREEAYPVPSDAALSNARRLLIAMYKISPQRFEVYPTPDSEVAIHTPSGPGCSVLLLCDSEGGAVCLVNMNGKHRRARYSETSLLPDGFVREALEELALRDERAA